MSGLYVTAEETALTREEVLAARKADDKEVRRLKQPKRGETV